MSGSYDARNNYQVKEDGTVELAANPTDLSKDQRKNVLKDALAFPAWTVTELDCSASNFVSLRAKSGDAQITVHAYIKPIGFANRSDANEKRIQFSDDYSDHRVLFELGNAGTEKCLILGFYSRRGHTVIVAWDIAPYLNHAPQASCYCKATLMAEAIRDGFATSGEAASPCYFRPELFHFYLRNIGKLHGSTRLPEIRPVVTSNPVPSNISRNRIYHGAPGTGKSFQLGQDVESLFPSSELVTRVTFHPDYSYGQFVGSYKPVPVYIDSDHPVFEDDNYTPRKPSRVPAIDYRFQPGPLIKSLCDALAAPDKNFVLVIEEINRAEVAAVFGDTFQLLDRDSEGKSEYSTRLSPDAMTYLRGEGHGEPEIRLPGNLYIWATMNSADQGVMPLDAAFKRRWNFRYVSLNEFQSVLEDATIHLPFATPRLPWNSFRDRINRELIGAKVPEDRLLGPFFLTVKELQDADVVKNKLLMYLAQDVLRYNLRALFNCDTFSEIIRLWDSGENPFKFQLSATEQAE